MERQPLPPSLDQYQGWSPSATSSSKPEIARVDNKISPEQMWDLFVSKRKPVVMQGLLPDPEWKGSKWTDLDYLRKAAGSVPVKIEPIHPTAGHFGTAAKRKQVLFSEYLDLLQDPQQRGKWYLTTQYEEDQDDSEDGEDQDGDDGHKDTEDENDEERDDDDDTYSAVSNAKQNIISDNGLIGSLDPDEKIKQPHIDPVLPAPTNALSNDFPLRPSLMPSLVLQQCNLWIGNSKEGKSSGLHHDFHDNLYMLLSGYKRFLLFPPSAHRYLHPRGHVERVHENGLIVYAPPGEVPEYLKDSRPRLSIRPDGLVPSDAARWRRQARLRVKQEADERAAAESGEGQKGKHLRKGKGKQTKAQELAEQALLQAEAELLLCRMDEEGIDPDAYTSSEEEDNSDDDDSDVSLDSAEIRRIFTLGAHPVDEASEEDESDSDDSDEEQSEPQLDVANLLKRKRTGRTVDHRNGLLLAPEDGHDVMSDSDSDGHDGTDDKKIKKRVKILAHHTGVLAASDHSDGTDGELNDESEEEEDEEDEDSDDSGTPLFGEAESGSEFGDVEEGEAELEKLLALSRGELEDEDDGGIGDDDDGEPQSFSRIQPQALHAYFNVADDPCKQSSSNGTRSKKSKRKDQCKTIQGDGLRPFKGCPEPIEVFLKPGEMLYLPASWYHEVTSSASPFFGQSGTYEGKTKAKEEAPVHMALNYWFHPPDALTFEEASSSSNSGSGDSANGFHVPGLGVEIGESARESLGDGTGTCSRPYRDAEVWDEVARTVREHVEAERRSLSGR